ncbi:lipopolysaccharide biosynthesis protein [Emticicia sp. SJ17W-69]|uniref:lipopolysaccharide biosynthesis protein n=1 Tax=Emticicia sp. SJ17W-69 TaxID=3421657 RepID=UPI003EBF1B70
MQIKKFFSANNIQSFKVLFYEKRLGRTILLDALSKGLPYLFLPLFLKLMPLTEYGLYTFIIYIITTGAYVFQFGFETAKSKLYFIYDARERGRMLFSMNFFLGLLFLAIVIIDLKFKIISTHLLNMPLQEGFSFEFSILSLILINAVITLLMKHLTLTNKVLTYQIWNTIKIFFVNAFVILIAYFLFNSTINAAQRIFYEALFSLIIILPLYIYFYSNHFEFKLDFKIMSRVFELGTPMMIGGIIAIAYNISDKYFIQKFIDYSALATYNLTLFLIMPIGLLFTSFFDSYWVPKFFNDNKKQINIDETNKVTLNLSFVLLLMLPVFLILIYFYLKLTNNPVQLHSIVWIFVIIYLSKSFDIFTQFYNNFFIVTEKTYQATLLNFIISVFIIVFNWVLIPKIGIIGAAIVLMLSSLVKFMLFFINAHKIAAKGLIS